MAFVASSTRASRPRSGIAFGGLGTGSFELRQDGIFYNWTIFNNPPLGLGAPFALAEESLLFFIVRCQIQGRAPLLRLLQIEPSHGAGGISGAEHHYIFPWLSGVDRIDYRASFPYCDLEFSDRDMPLSVRLRAYSPFIPHDVADSALPVAMFGFEIRCDSRSPVDVTLLASARNSVGYDVDERTYASGIQRMSNALIAELGCDGIDESHPSAGTLALASLSADATYYLGWEHLHPYYEIVLRSPALPNLDDTPNRNLMHAQSGRLRAMPRAFSSVARSERLAPGQSMRHEFVFAWHFPNGYAEEPERDGVRAERIEGHFYDGRLVSAMAVAKYAIENLSSLTERTHRFHTACFDTTAPAFFADQINSHLNTFRTSSWLTRAGDFGMLEGLGPKQPFAGLNTVDVAMYGSVAAGLLFPDLEKNMIETWARLQPGSGRVPHSVRRNFERAAQRDVMSSRVDVPIQFALLALRHCGWRGDRVFLKKIWPNVTRAIDYVSKARDKNGDGLPDQHGAESSYDNLPMFGASSYVGSQWLAALALAADAARLLDDEPAAIRYQEALERGKRVFDEKLYNGSYYCLYDSRGSGGGKRDEGCMTDQLFGIWTLNQLGFPAFCDPARVRSALVSIFGLNYRKEQGLRNCGWPGDTWLHDVRPGVWVDQANTCWTGVELAFAALLLHEGMHAEAASVVETVDTRYRRSGMYFDHQEFGGHYYRPMSAWAIPNALAGLTIYDGVYSFWPRYPEQNFKLLCVWPEGCGHLERRLSKQSEKLTVSVATGRLAARRIDIRPLTNTDKAAASCGRDRIALEKRGDWLRIHLPSALLPGEALSIVI